MEQKTPSGFIVAPIEIAKLVAEKVRTGERFVPTSFYEQYISASVKGPGITRVNDIVRRDHGFELRKQGDNYIVVAEVESVIRRADKKGRKGLRALTRQKDGLTSLARREDLTPEERKKVEARRSRAADLIITVETLGRNKRRITVSA